MAFVGVTHSFEPSFVNKLIGFDLPADYFQRMAGFLALATAFALYALNGNIGSGVAPKKTGVRVGIMFKAFALVYLLSHYWQAESEKLFQLIVFHAITLLVFVYGTYGAKIEFSLPAFGSDDDDDAEYSDRPVTRSVTGTPRRRPARLSSSRSKSPARGKSPGRGRSPGRPRSRRSKLD